MSNYTLELRDFGMGLLAGLHTRGVHILDDRELANLHKSFLLAFKVVEGRLGGNSLQFAIITHKVYGRTS